MFKNNPAALRVKCATPSEERLQQVWFPTPEGPQEGRDPTEVSLNEASFHKIRIQKDSSLKPFQQRPLAFPCGIAGLFISSSGHYYCIIYYYIIIYQGHVLVGKVDIFSIKVK